MSLETKVKMFKRMIQSENKSSLIKGVNVDSHKIFDIVDGWYISRIVH